MSALNKADLSDESVARQVREALKQLDRTVQLAASVGLKVRWRLDENQVERGNLVETNRLVRFHIPAITEIVRPV